MVSWQIGLASKKTIDHFIFWGSFADEVSINVSHLKSSEKCLEMSAIRSQRPIVSPYKFQINMMFQSKGITMHWNYFFTSNHPSQICPSRINCRCVRGCKSSFQHFSWFSLIGKDWLGPGYLNLWNIIKGDFFYLFSLQILQLYGQFFFSLYFIKGNNYLHPCVWAA